MEQSIYPAWHFYNLDDNLKLRTKNENKANKLKRAATGIIYSMKRTKLGGVLYVTKLITDAVSTSRS